MFLYVKSHLKVLLTSDLVKRVLHTAWQAAGSALVVSLLAARSSADAKAALFVAGAAALAAVKSMLLAKKA